MTSMPNATTTTTSWDHWCFLPAVHRVCPYGFNSRCAQDSVFSCLRLTDAGTELSVDRLKANAKQASLLRHAPPTLSSQRSLMWLFPPLWFIWQQWANRGGLQWSWPLGQQEAFVRRTDVVGCHGLSFRQRLLVQAASRCGEARSHMPMPLPFD